MEGLRSGVKLTLDALSGPRAISPPVFIVWCVLVCLRIAVTALSRRQLDPLPNLTAGLLTVLLGLVIMIAANRILRHWPRGRTGRIIFTLATYLVAVFLASYALISSDPASSGPPATMPARTVNGIILFCLIAAIFENRDRQLKAFDERTIELDRLRLVRNEIRARLVELRQQLGRLVGDKVRPSLVGAVRRLELLQTTPITASALRSIAAEVRQCSEQVVRNLSHELSAKQPKTESASVLETLPPRKPFRRPAISGWSQAWQLLVRASIARPVWAMPVATIMAIASVSVSMVVRPVSQAVVVSLLASVIAYACMLGAQHLLIPNIPAARWYFRLLCAFITYVITAAVMTAVIGYLFGFTGGFRTYVLCIFGLLLFGTISALAAAISEQRRATLVELDAILGAIEWEASRLHDGEAELRKQVGRLLHGDVQSRLNAVAIRLDLAADALDSPLPTQRLGSGHDIARTAVDDSINAIIDALAAVAMHEPANEPARGVLEGLASVVGAWRNAMSIHVECPDDVAVAIDHGGNISVAVVEAVREGISNAARHGHAQRVDVSIRLSGATLVVAVVDDGIGPPGHFEVGLGLGSFDRPGTTWQLRRIEPVGAQLIVEMPYVGDSELVSAS